ncbi:jerky protein homolog-like isoform X1 [Lethenteron reissneri]|uniref:jerky protein homolog-like isoform X1 n=1 Tax=Lethenteron reissneri TaxID=7753 RepID=UPI002AB7C103|nr:jerky protein homolog-like isoform X1 [Lethenteron reissneri]XP_061411389.1 jerky protein homolog-like isoform X1 [Lethenteron reissneri]
MEAWTPGAFLCTEPFVKQECDDNPGCEMWMEANVKQEELSDTAVRDWETRAPLIKSEHGEESTGCEFSEDDFQAEREDLQTKREQLRAYHSSLRPAVTCDPQGDHAVMGSCAEVEVELGDMNEAGSGRLACGICGRRFMNRNSLRRHMLLHEGDVGTKKHQCRLCLYATELATELHQHEKAHAVGRVHACGECGRDFVMASQLRAHLRVHAEGMRSRCDDGVKTTTLSPNPDSPVHIDLAGDGAQLSSSGKRRNPMPTLDKKVQVIKRFNNVDIASHLAAEHGCGKNTAHHLHPSRDKILSHVSASNNTEMPLRRNSTKTTVVQQLDSALFSWFKQRQAAGKSISSRAVVEQAQQLHRDLGIIEPLNVGCGWLHRFMHRHGIHGLNPQPERFSTEDCATSAFCRRFLRLVDAHALVPDQLYGATELELHWKGVSVAGTAMAAPDFIDDEEPIAVLCCANAAGTHRLPLAFIGRASKSRVLNGLNEGFLPAVYFQQNPTQSYSDICMTWFHHNFIPAVKDHLSTQGLAHKAVLVLADTPSHPEARPLHSVSNNCHIFAVYMPPSAALKLQPMEQGVVQSLHQHFMRGRLSKHSEDALTSPKEHVVMDVLLGAVAAWTQIETATLMASWHELWPSGEKLTTFSPAQPENGHRHEATNMALLHWQTGKTLGCRDGYEENMQTGCTWDDNQPSYKLPKDEDGAGENYGHTDYSASCFQNKTSGIVLDGHCMANITGENHEHVAEQNRVEDVDGDDEVNEDDDPPAQNEISARSALMALETVMQFLEQQPDTDHQEMVQLLGTRRKIKSKLSVSLRKEAIRHLLHGHGHLRSGKSPRSGPHCSTTMSL